MTKDDRESLLKKANYLRLASADIADSIKNGGFSSVYKGQGIDFTGVREYIRGDDVRAIDWNVTARMSRPYIKQFEETKELQVFLIVDASESMKIKNAKNTKYDVAAQAAAITAMACEINASPAGCALFDGEIFFSCNPKLSKTQTMHIITALERGAAQKTKGSALASAITGAGRLLGGHALVCIFSDFRVSGWEKPIVSLSQKNKVLAFRMQEKADFAIPPVGTALFKDAESGSEAELPSSSQEFQKRFLQYNKEHVEKWKAFCLAHGIFPISFDIEKDCVQVLDMAFRQKGNISKTGRL